MDEGKTQDVLDPNYDSLDKESIVRLAEEFRQAWFLSLAVLLMRNNLRVELTSEELDEARKLVITKEDDPDGKFIIFSAKVMGDNTNAGS